MTLVSGALPAVLSFCSEGHECHKHIPTACTVSSFVGLASMYSLWCARQAGVFSSMFQPQLLQGPSLPFRPEPGVTPFVVLAYQRTGSNILCSRGVHVSLVYALESKP